ncbi:unnamed protein product [Lampetra fluviatilis]
MCPGGWATAACMGGGCGPGLVAIDGELERRRSSTRPAAGGKGVAGCCFTAPAFPPFAPYRVSRHFNVPAFPPFFYVPAFPRRRRSRHFHVWAFPHFPQRRSRHFHRGSVFTVAAFPPFAPWVLRRPGAAPLQPCDYGPPSPH